MKGDWHQQDCMQLTIIYCLLLYAVCDAGAGRLEGTFEELMQCAFHESPGVRAQISA